MKKEPKKIIKSGVITSNKMTKTITVEVKSVKYHPLYKKQLTSTKKFHVHCDDEKKYTIGQQVQFIETKPYSKSVFWKVLDEKVKND